MVLILLQYFDFSLLFFVVSVIDGRIFCRRGKFPGTFDRSGLQTSLYNLAGNTLVITVR